LHLFLFILVFAFIFRKRSARAVWNTCFINKISGIVIYLDVQPFNLLIVTYSIIGLFCIFYT
jgi:hypothetical protein